MWPKKINISSEPIFEDEEYIFLGLKRGEIAVFAGAGGVGKSFLSQEWAIQLAAGEKMAGIKNFSSPPRKVFFGSFEGGEKEIQKRAVAIFRAMPTLLKKEKDIQKNLYMCSWRGMAPLFFAEKENTEKIQECIEFFKNFDFVILDPLSRIFCGEETNTNFSILVATLERIAISADVGILLLHHVAKNAVVDGYDDTWVGIRGGSTLITSVRCALTLSLPKRNQNSQSQEQVKLSFVKLNNHAPISPIMLSRGKEGVLLEKKMQKERAASFAAQEEMPSEFRKFFKK